MVMYKIDRRGGVQKSYTRTDPYLINRSIINYPISEKFQGYDLGVRVYS